MVVFVPAVTALTLLSMLTRSFARDDASSMRGGRSPQTEACTVVLRVTDYKGEAPEEIESWECFQRGYGHLKLLNLPPDWDDEVRGRSGKVDLLAPGAVIEGNFLTLPGTAKLNEILIPRVSQNRKLATSDRKVLVVHVTAQDSFPTVSASVLSDKVFGTDGDVVNLKSQFAACSYNKLNFEPAMHELVTDGVYNVTIDQTVTGEYAITVQNYITQQLQVDFGVDSIDGLFDHIMYVIPPGTLGSSNPQDTQDDWLASAYLDDWLSLYNDYWATFVSIQLHEIGHNENLEHSGEGGYQYQYDDQTCMMGYSYEEDDTPIMCFNAPKNWQLGWYDDRQISVTSSTGSWTGDLVGLSDYGDAISGQLVFVRIPGDFFVSFNRKAGINSGVVEEGSADKVLVHRKFFDDGKSNLFAKLSAGESFVYPNYAGSGADLIIAVDSITKPNDVPWFATVRICFGADACCGPAGNQCSSADDCCGQLLCLGKGRNKSCKGCDVDSDCDNGNVCDGSEQCVNNECVGDTNPPSNCCSAGSDCPDGQQCVENTCTSTAPCAPLGAECEVNSDCCGLKCRGKVGKMSCK